MSVPAAAIRDALESWLGQPYDQGPGRDDPAHYGHDCSGYMAAGWKAAHAGRTDGYVIANLSWSIFEQCAAAKLVVPWDDQYLALPAVLRWMPFNPDYPDGAGDGGHVGCTDGRGNMLEAWGGGGCSRTGPTFEQWDGYAGFFCDTDYTGHGIQPAPRNAGAQMLIQDNHTGKYWLLGPGHAHWVTTQSDIDLLHYLGVPDEYLSDPLVVISRMMTFGAWDTATNTPKTA